MSEQMSTFIMLGASFFAGYLSTMNMWVVNIKHARWHLNDLYMVLLMSGWMLLFSCITRMINSNVVLVISILLIISMIYAIRSQTLINDVQFLNGMIPHHSMAILMAEKIKNRTRDPRVLKLADDIIRSQSHEISLMTKILHETNQNYCIF